MGVTGAVTASQGATYIPPFKYVTSYAPAPLVTGTVTGTVANLPTVAAGASDADYADAYLQVHMMSWPSYRWAYLFWFVMIALAAIYAVAHHLRFSGGSFGASFARWGMKRKAWGRRGKGGARGRALPSNSVFLSTALIGVVAAVCAVVGADYVRPSSAILNFGTSFKRSTLRAIEARASAVYASPTYTINKSFWTSGSRFGFITFALMPLVVLFALKAPPVAVLAWRATTQLYNDKLQVFHRAAAWIMWGFTTIHVVLWTIQLFMDAYKGKPTWLVVWRSYRFIFGCVAYGCMTAVMVLSMKPIRKNKYEFFYICHVVFVFLTIVCSAIHHPVLWFWMAAALALWVLERFFRYIRFARINGLLGANAASKRSTGARTTVGGMPYIDVPTTDKGEYALTEIRGRARKGGRRPSDFGQDPYAFGHDKTLPRPPTAGFEGTSYDGKIWTPSGSSSDLHELGAGGQAASRAGSGYYDEGSLQPLGAYEQRASFHAPDAQGRHDPYADSRGPSPSHMGRPQSGYDPRSSASSATMVPPAAAVPQDRPYHQRGKSSVATMQSEVSISISLAGGSGPTPVPTPPVPAGYAHCQLLPSRTIRLTIRPVRPFTWSPGQSVLLYLPELSKLQSHPFTVVNNDENELVLLVKARKGLTRKLYNLVRHRSLAAIGINGARDKRLSLTSMQELGVGGAGHPGLSVPPIHLRAMVDGPMGSACRVRWAEFSSVLIVCGGSGVSFGMAVCDWVTRRMAQEKRSATKGWRTQRVRFCWVAREFAEIAWVAHALRLCRSMVPGDQLEISIFVTNASRMLQPADDFAPPRPGFAGSSGRDGSGGGFGPHSRSNSMESVRSDISTNLPEETDDTVDAHIQSNYADIIDFTNYEDEEDVKDPAEHELSEKMQRRGKIQRARSRKAAKGQAGRKSSYSGLQSAAGGQSGSQPRLGKSPSGLALSAMAQGAMARSTSGQYPPSAYASSSSNTHGPAAPNGRPSSNHLSVASYGGEDDFASSAENAYAAAARGSYYDTASSAPLHAPRPISRSHESSHSLSVPGASGHPPSGPFFGGMGNQDRRASYKSIADSTYGRYDPFNPSAGSSAGGAYRGGPSPSPSLMLGGGGGGYDDTQSIAGESMYGLLGSSGGGGSGSAAAAPGASRTQSMVLLEDHGTDPGGDAALWIDAADYESMMRISEFARPGKPKLKEVLEEEIAAAQGALIVATCGPATLNTVMRNLVSQHISPAKIRHGDRTGHIAIYSEDYES